VGGEEPDLPERNADGVDAPVPPDTPFRTPDPMDVGISRPVTNR
jgi:hypothetical protein